MDVITTAFLVGTGVVAGIIAAMVGGAAVVIYPALIATGVSPQLAAVSNLASVMPATMLAALSDRSQLPPFNRAFIGLIIASVIGAGAGAVLLLLTPERMFAQMVPLLIGFATLLFAFAERITRWLRARAEGLGLEGKAGLMGRAERVVLLTAILFLAPFGALPYGIAFMAAVTSATVVQRLISIHKQLSGRTHS